MNVGLSGYGMRNALTGAVVMPMAFLIGSRWGAAGIAAAWIGAYPFVIGPFWRIVLKRIDLPATRYFRAMWPAASSSLLMAVGVLAMRLALPASWALGARFAILVCTGAAIYLAALFMLHGRLIREGRDLLGRLRTRT